MGMMDVLFWPFAAAFAGAMIVVGIIFLIIWIWMIIDCAKRRFKNDVEKVLWIIALVLLNWIGIIVYFIVIKSLNPSGLIRHN